MSCYFEVAARKVPKVKLVALSWFGHVLHAFPGGISLLIDLIMNIVEFKKVFYEVEF